MGQRPATDRYGFRYRGSENTRIEAFTDAAFAFAVTLLMIGGGNVPTTAGELLTALRNLPGYAASFALLCLFWFAHYKWYRRYGVENGRSILLSLLLVFLVLIYVYPLHMMFSAAISVGGRPASDAFQIRTWADWKIMYVVFGIAYASMSVVILLFYALARSLRDELELDVVERAVTDTGVLRWAVSACVGMLSASLALALSPQARGLLYALPGFAYWLIAFANPVLRRWQRRRIEAGVPT
ncbi:MAG TPA: TMEM175 family protein [Rhodanobacteraceae bacterium]|nr:TMEM175 family protein [Rhodanobacteraceae bacterium]